jgi:hypothetical protein
MQAFGTKGERVSKGIPDLWRMKEDVPRLYELYMCRLQANYLHHRIIYACRSIRRYAARGPGREKALFTFSFEIDALCSLEEYKTAWRQLRLREEVIFGKRLDLRNRRWSAEDAGELEYFYVPLLFFLGRYEHGCELLETSLDFWFNRRKLRSYDILFRVFNADKEPRNRYRITLSHFYERLGKDLRQWQHWEAFVGGFHPRLFRLSGVARKELLANSRHLKIFFDRLMVVRAERMISGISFGQSDLIDSASKVRKRQEAKQLEIEEFDNRISPTRENTDQKLQELFPELRKLPRQT